MKMRSMVAAIVASTALLFATDRVEAEKGYVINFGTVAPGGTPWADQLQAIKKRVEAESNNKITVNLFMGGSLGSEIEMIQDVKRGERLQGGGFSTGAVGEALDIPELTMLELPYLFKNNEEADTVLDSVVYEPAKAALAKKGVSFYAWSENGWRCFATKGGPATSPEELKKYKMRSQESPVHLDMYNSMGVQAVPKPTSEVLPSLNTGIVTGFDNTALFSLAGGWIGSVSHFTLSKHIYQPAAVIYSQSFIDGLPEDLRTLVLKDPLKESASGRKAVRDFEKDTLPLIEEMGVKVVALTPKQKKSFRKAVRKKTHSAFLAKNPSMQNLYGDVDKKLKSLRK
ncbi:MAG: TRAP transporter substrate-binding protein [Myxococcota bacterium]|nr:TRAP transporter substrate-binding protein [Myxococcota bacterium]